LARDVVFWKGLNKQIEDMVAKCSICQNFRGQQQKEPMLSTEVPTLPWQNVSSDLFEYDDEMYLTTIDHYSGYIEIDELKPNQTTSVVIEKLKRIFCTHGIPQVLHSDPGTQFTSNEFNA
jgi:transposase InsO family protein